MKYSRIMSVLMTALAAIALASCISSPDVPTGDVVVSLSNYAESSLIPDTVPQISTYTVSLAEVVSKDGEWQLVENAGKRTESFPGSSTEFVFENVKLGTYTVSIQGLGRDAKPVLNGSGTENLSVSAVGTNSVSVDLAPISDNRYTGAVSMTFDWADLAISNETVISSMENGGLVFILYRYDDVASEWVEAGRSPATGTEATRYEFVVDGLPVSTGLRLKYALSNASGVMLNPILTTPIAQVYANLTSVQDANGDRVYRISANEISSATNVKDVSWTYGPDEGTSVIVSWKNQIFDSESLFDYVTVRYTSVSGVDKEERISADSSSSSITIRDMAMGDEYTLTFQAHHKSGLVSPVYTYPEKIVAEVLIKAPENVSAKKTGNAIAVSWDAVSGADSYAIYRSTDGGDFEKLAEAVKETEYSDAALYAGKEYSYKVQGFRGETEGDLSEATEPLSIADSVISITTTMPDKNFSILLKEAETMAILPDTDGITVSVDPIEGVLAYTWYINGVEAKSGSADNGGTFIGITTESAGIRTDLENGLNTLTLAVTTAKGTFSAEVKFAVVTVLDEGVTVNVPDDQTRLSTKLENGENRTLMLSAAVFPETATMQSITFRSDNEEIATVDASGKVTFTGGTGEVKITASPSYGESTDITFDVFDATVTSAEDLVNAINKELNKHVSAANTKFEGDWWPGEFASTYESENVSIKSSTGASQSAGNIEFSSYSADTSIGKVSINGKIMIFTIPQGVFDGGYLGTDPLETIGYGNNNNTLTITLPGNQGIATIKYNSVNVIDRGGSYTVSFSDTIGFKEGSFHGGSSTVNDSSSITAIL